MPQVAIGSAVIVFVEVSFMPSDLRVSSFSSELAHKSQGFPLNSVHVREDKPRILMATFIFYRAPKSAKFI
jgi:hypothetical protein